MPIDYKKYPPNWKTEIVPAILERAKNQCECCGLANYQTVFAVRFWIKDEARYKLKTLWFSSEGDARREACYRPVKKCKVVLTISHTDHDEHNWDVTPDRLKALCQLCHLRYDAKEKYRRSLERNKINNQ